jgi:hypothetical protein
VLTDERQHYGAVPTRLSTRRIVRVGTARVEAIRIALRSRARAPLPTLRRVDPSNAIEAHLNLMAIGGVTR